MGLATVDVNRRFGIVDFWCCLVFALFFLTMSRLGEQEVAGLLSSAVKVVNESGAEGDLKLEAFKVAISLLAPKGSTRPLLPLKTDPSDAGEVDVRDTPRMDGDDPLTRIANYLGCDRDGLHHVFGVHDGEPRLTIKSKVLPNSNKQAVADIALLLMAARQGAEVDDFTEPEVLKSEVTRYGKMDSSNYSKSFKGLEGLFETEGSGQQVKRKLTQPGIEAAAEKVSAYIEASQG